MAGKIEKSIAQYQYFKSIDEITEHYSKCHIKPLDDEMVLDSVLSVENLLDKIMEAIK